MSRSNHLMHRVLLLQFCVVFCLLQHQNLISSVNAQTCTTYTIKSGDTCYDISQAIGVSLSNFLSWNPGINCNNLQIGQEVCVSQPSSSSDSCTTYTIKAGDTCYDISQAIGVSLSDFLSWNPDINCNNLQIGQEVCVSQPSSSGDSCTTYTIKSGDTCYDISQAIGVSLSDFLSWNPGINCNNLQIGQEVCISEPSSTPAPPPPPPSPPSPPPPPVTPTPPSGGGNGKVFQEYIGANWAGVSLSDVPINPNVEFRFILSFAIDYQYDGTPTNGVFDKYFQYTIITPDAINSIKSSYSNVKFLISLGGDTINSNPVQFRLSSISSWVSNAVSSLTSLIQEYHLDGIDIDYEHFDYTTDDDFASAIGQVVSQLKNNGVISVASIAPFNDWLGVVASAYTTLWSSYGSLFDYVNYQFYAHGSLTISDYVNMYNSVVSTYSGGKVLASFNTAGIGTPPSTVLSACEQLQSSDSLPGIFVWSADNSYTSSSGFTYETQAQALLADNSYTSSFGFKNETQAQALLARM